MSHVQEFYTVYVNWQWFARGICGEEMVDWNFEKNMEAFDDHVNEHLVEGWRLHGSPTFSAAWLNKTHNGLAIHALVRDKNIEPVVIVHAQLPVVAENVKATRSSLRLKQRTND